MSTEEEVVALKMVREAGYQDVIVRGEVPHSIWGLLHLDVILEIIIK